MKINGLSGRWKTGTAPIPRTWQFASAPCPTPCGARMPGDYGTEGGARPRGAGCSDHDGTPARFFLCGRCRAQVFICSQCDRGQIYCGAGCARQARRRSLRDAGRRYQDSRRGRLAHAERARRYRLRRNNVTHQGSPLDRRDDLLSEAPAATPREELSTDNRPRWQCHRCGRRCPELVRRNFLRRRVRRGPEHDHSR